MANETFHPGEVEVQVRVGVQERIGKLGSMMIRDNMPQQHRDFYSERPFLLAATLDADGWPWASIIIGSPGFAHAADEKQLDITTRLIDGDPIANHIRDGVPIGLLGIEFDTRRRNRLNGHVLNSIQPGIFSIRADQTFGNCPKYIQARDWKLPDDVLAALGTPHARDEFTEFDAGARQQLEASDTFFIASAFIADDQRSFHGCDVSHRGGRPGFVQVTDNRTLLFPDYVGNFMFNTLGNLARNPRCGLLFIDFDSGDTLQLIGEAEALWDRNETEFAPGAQRMMRFRLHRGLHIRAAVPIRWGFIAYSPFLDGLK